MRKLSLVLSFLVTAVLATLAFNYAAALAGERRTYVQESWVDSTEPMAYQSYGESEAVGR
jgi:hypothetical protein